MHRSPIINDAGKSTDITPQEREFCMLVNEGLTPAAAFRAIYNARGTRTPWHLINASVRKIMVRPEVRLFLDELKADRIAQMKIKAGDILRDLVDIADADPNELIKGERFACRHCYGTNHAYQWRDMREMVHAWDDYNAAVERQTHGRSTRGDPPAVRPADDRGGFGFDPKAQPYDDCPVCNGDGHFRVSVADTTRLSPQARKLYKGLKVRPDGSIEVLMHDQMQARDMAIRLLVGYKGDQNSVYGGEGLGAFELAQNITQEQAAAAYQRLLTG